MTFSAKKAKDVKVMSLWMIIAALWKHTYMINKENSLQIQMKHTTSPFCYKLRKSPIFWQKEEKMPFF